MIRVRCRQHLRYVGIVCLTSCYNALSAFTKGCIRDEWQPHDRQQSRPQNDANMQCEYHEGLSSTVKQGQMRAGTMMKLGSRSVSLGSIEKPSTCSHKNSVRRGRGVVVQARSFNCSTRQYYTLIRTHVEDSATRHYIHHHAVLTFFMPSASSTMSPKIRLTMPACCSTGSLIAARLDDTRSAMLRKSILRYSSDGVVLSDIGRKTASADCCSGQ